MIRYLRFSRHKQYSGFSLRDWQISRFLLLDASSGVSETEKEKISRKNNENAEVQQTWKWQEN